MGWVLRLVETETDSPGQGVDVMEIRSTRDLGDIAHLGLTVPKAKQLLTHVQQAVVGAQIHGHAGLRPDCSSCGGGCHIQDWWFHRVATLFGVVTVRLPRFRCVSCRHSETCVNWPLHCRSTPELDQLRAHFSAPMLVFPDPSRPYSAACANAGSDDRASDLTTDRGGPMRETQWQDHRPAGRQRRRAEGGVSGVHHDAPSGDAPAGSTSWWYSGEAGHLDERCPHVWHLRHAAVCQNVTTKHPGRTQRRIGALEQRADGRTDQPTENAQAGHVWPRRGSLLRGRMIPLQESPLHRD